MVVVVVVLINNSMRSVGNRGWNGGSGIYGEMVEMRWDVESIIGGRLVVWEDKVVNRPVRVWG